MDADLDQPRDTAESTAPQPQARNLQQRVTKLERKVKSLKNIVQWLKVERRQLSGDRGRGRAAHKRRCYRCKQLRRKVKDLKYNRPPLTALYEKYRGLLKVRESQWRRSALLLRRKKLHDRLDERGPKAIESVSQRTVTSFRCRVWQTSGGGCGRSGGTTTQATRPSKSG